MEIDCGQFVLSEAGRDKGKIFVTVEIIDDEYVRIADGKLRSIGKPKKKKLKHLRKIDFTGVKEIAVDMSSDKKLYETVKAASETYRENREGLFCQKMM